MTPVSELWNSIEVGSEEQTGWMTRRIRPGTTFDLLAARRVDDNALALLFAVPSRTLPPWSSLPDCIGFHAFVELLEAGPEGRCRICLVLKDQRYGDVFSALAQDVVDNVFKADGEASAVRTFLARLNTWQRFLERFGLNILSREEQAGLFAELSFLERHLIPLLGPAGATASWQGPYAAPQDFTFGSVAVEVKATTNEGAAVFRVANLEQLDPGTSETLLLSHVSLSTTHSEGRTLPEIVTKVRDTIAGMDPGAATTLDAALFEAGYLDTHAGAYATNTFKVIRERWFHVRDDFPRLTTANVSLGVAAVRYSVSLSGCIPFEVQPARAAELMAGRAE